MIKPKLDLSLPFAVYIGLDSMPGLQTVRILARKGVPVIGVVENPKDHGCLTNVCKDIIYTNTSTEELITKLEELGKTLNQKAVLFTGQESNVLVVSRNRKRLEKYYYLIFPDQDILELLIDKISF